jgi:hypothetical protein
MQAQYSHGQNQSNGARLGSTDTGQGANGAGIGHGNGEDPTKRNPLVDLMDSEKVYVEQLGLVIRVSPIHKNAIMGDWKCGGLIAGRLTSSVWQRLGPARTFRHQNSMPCFAV